MFKKIIMLSAVLILVIGAFVTPANQVFAQEKKVVIVYSTTCPHCRKLVSFVEVLKKNHPSVSFELNNTASSTTHGRWKKLKKKHGINENYSAVPMTFIGDEFVIGFGAPSTTGVKINKLIKQELY